VNLGVKNIAGRQRKICAAGFGALSIIAKTAEKRNVL